MHDDNSIHLNTPISGDSAVDGSGIKKKWSAPQVMLSRSKDSRGPKPFKSIIEHHYSFSNSGPS
jgi:hypothetical protein